MITNDQAVASSNLAQLLGKIKAMLAYVVPGVPVQIGTHYERSNQGNPPLIRFIPETGPGRIGPPIELGHAAASCSHSCAVVVRAKPCPSEEDRFGLAYDLLDKVIGVISAAATGRIEWGAFGDDSQSTTDSPGSPGLRFEFVYRRDVPHVDKVWSLPAPVDGTERPIKTSLELSGYEPPGERRPEPQLEATPIVTPTVIPEV
jgi:hypothetical protein